MKSARGESLWGFSLGGNGDVCGLDKEGARCKSQRLRKLMRCAGLDRYSILYRVCVRFLVTFGGMGKAMWLLVAGGRAVFAVRQCRVSGRSRMSQNSEVYC
jgi:hypothetical protein